MGAMEQNELEELVRDIRKNVQENKKFLEKVLDEDFDPGEGIEQESTEDFEEL